MNQTQTPDIEIVEVFFDPSDIDTDLSMITCLLDAAKGRNYRHARGGEEAFGGWRDAIIVWEGDPSASDEALIAEAETFSP